jgi:site-specific DNA recombinase
MIQPATETKKGPMRCAVYCRKSHEEGLEQEFNSLDAQRESCEAYIASQRHEGWTVLPTRYDDGGFTGGNMDRPAVQQLLKDIEAGRVDCIVVYKVDRLSRSLLDFAKLIGLLDQHGVSFVSITQRFDTSTSMGRLTLNVLLSFAQFEREVIGERIRDKISAAKRRGQWIGGHPFLGYDIDHVAKKLVVNEGEAKLVRLIFQRLLKVGSCKKVAREINGQGHRTKRWQTAKGKANGGGEWHEVNVHRILTNPAYVGLVRHKDQKYQGQHEAIIDQSTWDRVQSLLEKNARNRASETRRVTPALLKGILRCGHCGTAMGATFTKRRGRRYRYYLCNHAGKSGYDACPVKSVAADQIEAAVVDQLRGIFRSPEVIAATYRSFLEQAGQQQDGLRREKDALERRLVELKKMVRNLARLAVDGPAAAVSDELRKVNDECAAAEARLAELNAQLAQEEAALPSEQRVAEALREIDPLWTDLYPAEQERIVRLLVEQVVMEPDSLTVRLRPAGVGELVGEMGAVENGAEADVEERLVTA